MLVIKRLRQVSTFAILSAALIAGCNSGSSPDATDSFEVAPTDETIGVGETKSFTAKVVNAGGATDVTGDAKWSSSNTSIATIDSNGLAKGVASGEVTVVASKGSLTASTKLTVTSAKLVLISVSPGSAAVAKGTTAQFAATGTYSDGAKRPLTSGVSWSSSASSTATVDPDGLATGVNPGDALIKATQGDLSGSSELTVTEAELTELEISPNPISLAVGTAQNLTVTGTFSDATTQELTSEVSWSSSADATAKVSDSGDNKGTVTAVSVGTVTINVSFKDKTASASVIVTDATLTSLKIEPTRTSLPKGTSRVLVATGTFSDGSNQDISSTVAWTTSNKNVAVVSNSAGSKGKLDAVSAGESTITGTRGKISGSAAITVTGAELVSISVTPTDPKIAKGVMRELVATGTYSDDSTHEITADVTWSSTDPSIASVSNDNDSKGETTALNVGTTKITASMSGKSGSANLTVSAAALTKLDVTPDAASIAVGITQAYVATGTYTDGTTEDLTSLATWSSASPNNATVSNGTGQRGRAIGKAAGSTQITATSGDITSTAVTLTVTGAALVSIAVTPSAPSIAKGTTKQFLATGTFSDTTTRDITSQATWTSSVPGIASVSSTGLATAGITNAGTTLIVANLGNIASTPITLTVTSATLVSIAISPAEISLAKGTTKRFAANGSYSDHTSQDLTSAVTWSTSSAATATISNDVDSKGLAAAVATGSAFIRATLGSGASAVSSPTATLTVTNAVLATITVDPASPSIANGTTKTFTATGHYSDGTPQALTGVTWASSDQTVATITSEGIATGALPGQTEITAAASGITSTPVTLTITDAVLTAIKIITSGGSDTDVSLAAGTTFPYKADGIFSDQTRQDLTSAVTWSSSDDNVATISNATGSQGVARGLVKSTSAVTITASLGGTSFADTADLTITDAELDSITVTPGAPTVPAGLPGLKLHAIGNYSDGSTAPIDEGVYWTFPGGQSIASISNFGDSTKGDVSTHDPGSIQVSADYLGKSKTITLTVTDAVLTEIQLDPPVATIAQQIKQQFKATGVYSDGSLQTLTSAVTWDSDDASAVISGDGLATGSSPGVSTISATFGGKTGEATLTVSNATLDSISVWSPFDGTPRPKGLTRRFRATGHFSEGPDVDLSTQVSWSTRPLNLGDPDAATVSNAVGSEGVATAIAVGTNYIGAALLGVTGTQVFEVNNAALLSIQVAGPATTASGLQGQFTATGTYTDNTHLDITTDVTWAADNTASATPCVVASVEVKGCFDAKIPGDVVLTASKTGGVLGTTPITKTQAWRVTDAVLTHITLSPLSSSVAAGLTLQYQAIGSFTDSTTLDITNSVVWSSSQPDKVTLSNANPNYGLATAVAATSTDAAITATVAGGGVNGVDIAGSTWLTVAAVNAIEVTPSTNSIAAGLGGQYTATALLSVGGPLDVTSQAAWTTTDGTIATVTSNGSSRGFVSALTVGTVTVNATALGVTGGAPLTVTDALLDSITVDAVAESIANGTHQQYTATGLFSDGTHRNITTQVAWTSSQSNVSLSADGAGGGVATGTSVGATVITATVGAVTGTKSLEITPATLASILIGAAQNSIAKGQTQQYEATGVYTDATQQSLTTSVTWTTNPGGIVSIGPNTGFATAGAVGSTTITATFPDPDATTPISQSIGLSVTPAVVDSVSLTPLTPTTANGTTRQFTLRALYSDATTSDVTKASGVVWTTSTPATALISNATSSRGLASSVGVGTTTITGSYSGRSANTVLTVSNATLVSIAVTPANPSTPLGFTRSFTATALYSDGSTLDRTGDVTWSSTDESIGLVSNSPAGLGTTVNTGTTTVRATLGSTVGQTMFTVTDALLDSIAITPSATTFAVCGCQTLTATGTFSDATTTDITSRVVFSSSNNNVVNVAPLGGGVTGACADDTTGSVTITATDQSTGKIGTTGATNNISCGP